MNFFFLMMWYKSLVIKIPILDGTSDLKDYTEEFHQ